MEGVGIEEPEKEDAEEPSKVPSNIFREGSEVSGNPPNLGGIKQCTARVPRQGATMLRERWFEHNATWNRMTITVFVFFSCVYLPRTQVFGLREKDHWTKSMFLGG
jgi:hypothetical protein